ncbi:unnamed protein product, partial [Hapterophycus canaliculatus]
MVDPPSLVIVGVPGMGNAEPSWHQRRPYGFSKSGYGKAQCKLRAYRRPSTASGRLSSAPTAFHRQLSPKAFASDRSEYWGNHGGGGQNSRIDNNHDRFKAGATLRPNFFQRPQGAQGLRTRDRPSSAGYYRASSPGSAAPAPSAVEICTRNRAGIVRGGGRDGRAAPPPTPPSHDYSSQRFESAPRRPQQQQQQQHQQVTAAAAAAAHPSKHAPLMPPFQNVNRRRPSTGGARRSNVTTAVGEIGDTSREIDHRCDNASEGGDWVNYPPSGGGGDNSLVSHGRGTGGTPAADEWRASKEGLEPEAQTEQRHSTAAAAIPLHTPQSSSLDQSTTIYRRSSRSDSERNRDSRGAPSCRRRPASATALFRSRGIEDCDHRAIHNNGEEGRAGGGYSYCENVVGFDANRKGEEAGRGRRAVGGGGGAGLRRPRSASPTTGSIESAYRYGVDGGGAAQQQYLLARRPASAAAAVQPFSKGHGCGRTDLRARLPPENAAVHTPPAVVPSFVVSEKQVLRFFGYLTEELDWGCPSRNRLEQTTGEPPSPTRKIRQVIVHLFLADGSIEIFEKHQANSGQQGGLLLKRNIFRKRDGSIYDASDLTV